MRHFTFVCSSMPRPASRFNLFDEIKIDRKLIADVHKFKSFFVSHTHTLTHTHVLITFLVYIQLISGLNRKINNFMLKNLCYMQNVLL